MREGATAGHLMPVTVEAVQPFDLGVTWLELSIVHLMSSWLRLSSPGRAYGVFSNRHLA